MKKQYIVIRTIFDQLETWLNTYKEYYPGYTLFNIIPEHSYDGALAVIILQLTTPEANIE